MKTVNLFRLNPVTLKELRQMVRSKLVSTGLIVFLFLQLAAVSIALLISRNSVHNAADLYGQGLGSSVFGTVSVLLAGVLLLGIPLFISIRMAMEKSNERMDLQFTTVLTPSQFVDGKIVSAVVLMLLFASTSLPFLMLAYLLRGVDVFAMLRTFAFISVEAICVFYLALLVGSMNISKVFRILLMIGMVNIMIPLIGGITAAAAFGLNDVKAWQVVVAFLMIATGCAMVRSLTAALLAPPHANSVRPLRRLVLLAWVLWGIAAASTSLVDKKIGWIFAWALISVLISIFMLVLAVSSRPGCSRRVLSEISRRKGMRFIQFPFFTGAENGICFTMLMGLVSVLVFQILFQSASYVGHDEASMPLFLLSFFCYAGAFLLTMRLLWHALFCRFMTHKLVGIIAILLMMLSCVLPYLLTMSDPSDRDSIAQYWPGNFAATFGDDKSEIEQYHTIVSCAWCILAAVFFLPIEIRAFAKFRPPDLNGPV